MPKHHEVGAERIVSGVFWDALSFGNAVATLLRWGFSDSQIETLGLLEGSSRDLGGLLNSMGISSPDAEYYNSCFHDGCILLIIRTGPFLERIALEIIRRHGAVLPPSRQTHATRVS